MSKFYSIFYLIVFFIVSSSLALAQSVSVQGQSRKYYQDDSRINYVYVNQPNLVIPVNINILTLREGQNPNFIWYGYSRPTPIPPNWQLKVSVNNNSNYTCLAPGCSDNKIQVKDGFNEQILEVRASIVDETGRTIANNIKIEYFLAPNFVAPIANWNSCLGIFELEVNEITENKDNSRPYTLNLYNSERNLIEEFTSGDGLDGNFVFGGALDNQFFFKNLQPGNYSYRVKNNIGQVTEGVFTVFEAYFPRANLIFAGFECADSDYGIVDVRVENGKTPISWSLVNVQTNSSIVTSTQTGSYETFGLSTLIPNIAAGEYKFSFTDGNSCSDEIKFFVTRPIPLIGELYNKTDISCPEGDDGIIRVNVSGGWTEPFAGNYINPEFWGQEYNVKFFRNGQEYGQIDENIFFYTFPYEGPQNSWQIELFNAPAGEYYLEVSETFVNVNTDQTRRTYSCSKILGPYILNEPPPFDFNQTKLDVLCFGESTGKISIAPTGGTADYAVTWYKGNFSNVNNPGGLTELIKEENISIGAGSSIGSLAAGRYAVLVEDNNGCRYAKNFLITQPDDLLFRVDNVVHVNCYGGASGAIKALVTSESVAPYTYTLVNLGADANSLQYSHTTGATEWIFTGLPAGQYQLKITDANNCTESLEDVITILQPEEDFRFLTSEKKDVICFSENNGEIIIEVAGGGGPDNLDGYTYQWLKNDVAFAVAGESVDTHLINLAPAKYRVLVTDKVGCVITSENFQVEEPAILNITPSIQNVKCYNGRDGAIGLLVTGGVGEYIYSWEAFEGGELPAGQEAIQNLSGLKAGKYNVLIKDRNNCELLKSFTITEPQQLLASVSDIGHVSCFGEATGKITANLDQQSVGNYTVTLSGINISGQAVSRTYPLSSSFTFTGLKAGTYEVKVIDGNQCTVEINDILINQPESGLVVASGDVSTFGGYHISCFGSNDGWIVPTISGGEGEYQMLWTGPNGFSANTVSISNLIAGVYSLLVTDGNGCTAGISYTLTQPQKISLTGSISNFNGFGVSCYGATNGAITLNVEGGTSSFQFNWSSEDGNLTDAQKSQQNLTDLSAGTYFVEVKDFNGCLESKTFILNQPDELLLNDAVPVDVLCKGNTSGSIELSLSKLSVAPYQYTLMSGGAIVTGENRVQPGILFVNLPAGSYTVWVVDGNGCMKETPIINILEPEAGMVINEGAITDISCFGAANGTIAIDITGGGGPSNNPQYTFNWMFNGQPFSPNANSNERQLTGLAPGKYQVMISDGNGCSVSSREFFITQPDNLTVSGLMSDYNGFGISRKNASDGNITLTVNGGTVPYQYSWTTVDGLIPVGMEDQKDISGITAGTYVVEIVDRQNCPLTKEFVLAEPDALELQDAELFHIDCYGEKTGRIIVTIEKASVGPFMYILSGTTFENNAFYQETSSSTLSFEFGQLLAGEYAVTVRDANGVEERLEDLIILHPSSGMSIIDHDVNPVTCFGYGNGSISILVAGGGGVENNPNYTYTWYKDGQIYPLQAGDAPDALINLSPAKYYVVVEDGHGCTITSGLYEITQPEKLRITGSVSAYSGFEISCNGFSDGDISLTVEGGIGTYRYKWTTSDGILSEEQTSLKDLSGLPPGTYTILVEDENDCTTSAEFTLAEPAELLLDEASRVDVQCKGEDSGAITVQIIQQSVGPYIYSLIQGNSILNSQQSNQTSFTFESLYAGIYSIEVKDNNGCIKSISSIEILQPDLGVEFTLEDFTPISCFNAADGIIKIEVQGGGGPSNLPDYSFHWTLDGNIFQPNGNSTVRELVGLQPGLYSVTVYDGFGCSVTSREFRISQPDQLIGTGILSDYNGFQISKNGSSDGEITLTVVGGTIDYQYSWTTEDGLIPNGMEDRKDLTGLIAGTYKVHIIDNKNCEFTEEFTLNEPDELKLKEAIIHNVNCFGEATGSILVQIEKASVAPFTFILGGGSSSSFTSNELAYDFKNLLAGSYQVSVRDANGAVEILEDLVIRQPSSGMEIIDRNVQQITCYGYSNGSINIKIAGGGGVDNAPVYTYAWYRNDQVYPLQEGDEPEALINLSPGSYHAVVEDGHGCSFVTDRFEITQPDKVVVSGTISDYSGFGISCQGAADGSINLSLSGGTGSFTYQWTTIGGELTEAQKSQKDLAGLPAGSYTVVVVDENNCSESATFNLNQPDELILDEPVLNHVMCKGESTGSIQVTIAQESVGPYTYTLFQYGNAIRNTSTVDPTVTFEGIAAGNYVVFVKDNNGCAKETAELEILEPEIAFEFTLQEKTDILCSGDANGTVSVNIIGGGGPENNPYYTFNWFYNGQPFALNDLSTDRELKGLTPGDYYVIVEDGFGCSIRSNTLTIIQPDPLQIFETISDYNGYEISCHGGNDGSISLTIAGGSGGYEYTWFTEDGLIPTGSIYNQNLTGLTAGTYTVTLKDSNECELSASFTLRDPEVLIISEDRSLRQNIACFGEATGEIVVVAAGGNAPYKYIIEGVTFEGIAYAFTSSFTNQNIFHFEDLKAGVYHVSMEDQNGCGISIATAIKLTQPDAPLRIKNEEVSDYNGFNISCFGETDAFIHLEVDGGVGPYIYNWTGPNGFTATSLNLDEISPGEYTFTLTDQNRCEVIRNYVLIGPDPIEVETLQQNVLCGGEKNGNIFILEAKGGTGNFQFVWIEDGKGEISRTYQPKDLRNVGPGKYALIVTDGSDCEWIKIFTITEPEPVVVQLTAKKDNVCFGENDGSIDVSVNGGTGPYTYSWTGPNGFHSTSGDLQQLYAGDFLLNVTDALQCVQTLQVTIDEPAEIVVQETIKSITCFGQNDGQISIAASGGVGSFQYRWTGPNGFVSNSKNIKDLFAGVYILSITDEINCTVEWSFIVKEPEELKVNPIISDYNGFEISCKGGSNGFIDLQITGGTGSYTVIWEGPNGYYSQTENIVDLYPGEYEVFVKDENNCWIKATFNLKEPDQLVIGEENLSPKMVSCFNGRDGSILVNLSNESVGPYFYEIKGQYLNGVYHQESIETTALQHVFSDLRAGIYNVSVTDANGCHITEVAGVEISQPKVALEAKVLVNDVKCYLANNGSVDVQPQGGTSPYTILWSNGAESWSMTNLAPGTYTAVVRDKNGCEVNVITEIKEAPVYKTDPEVSDISCKGQVDGYIKLNIIGGIAPVKVKWDHGPQTPDLYNLPSGIYKATILDGSNCEIRQEFVINEPDQLNITSSVTNALDCDNSSSGAIELNPSGGTPPFTYAWSNGSQERLVDNLAPGQYSVRVIDARGCALVRQFTIQRPEPIQVAVIQYPHKICEPRTLQTVFQTTVTGGQPPYVISWNRGALSSDGYTMVTQEEGLFTLTVTDDLGCEYVESFKVIPDEDIVLDFSYSSDSYTQVYEYLTNFDIHFKNNSAGEIREFGWDFGDGNTSKDKEPVHKFSKPGVYTVTLTMKDIEGCTDYIQKEISIADYFLEVPNVFTPNDDGINDQFFPKFIHIKSLEFWILNKWGEYIYYSNNLDDKGWDGTLSNEKAPQGNYIYKLKYTTLDGRLLERSGPFFLAR